MDKNNHIIRIISDWVTIEFFTTNGIIFIIAVMVTIGAILYFIFRNKNKSPASVNNQPNNIINNINNYGLPEDILKQFIESYKLAGKTIAEIEESIKNYQDIKQDLAHLTGDNEQVKQLLKKAEEHLDTLEFKRAIDTIKAARLLEQQDLFRAADNVANIALQQAEKFALQANIAALQFEYQTARDYMIEAYQSLIDNIAPAHFNNEIRKTQLNYLNYITNYSLHAGLYNNDITIKYATLAKDFGQEHLGRDHPNTLTSMNNLAELYRVQGRYEEAEPLYEKALNGIKKTYPSDHPHIKTVQKNLEYLKNNKNK